MAQQHERSSSKETELDEAAQEKRDRDLAKTAERKEELDGDVDSILDEIDNVLETNAEDFVKAYVQKGGQ